MKSFFRMAWRENGGLRIGIVFNVLLALGALGAMPFDHRLILGINPWIKPLKFDLSVLIYLGTIAALLAWLGRFPKSRAWIGWAIGLLLVGENGIISLQSLRGVRSHMNFDTTLDALLFAAMGQMIALNTAALAWLLVLYARARTEWPQAVAWGARLGLVTLLAGSLEGVYMVVHRAHTVGAQDGLPGLPFVNWSRQHGDLRIPHFFALHALQAMMLLGFLLWRTRLSEQRQLIALVAGWLLYVAAVGALFAQAMAGHPLLAY